MSNFYDYMFSANKSTSNADEKVVEDKKDDYHITKYYTIRCRDGEKQLLDLINYIGDNGNGGHSFDIVVDPGDKKNERHFFWDGDGSDRIMSVVSSTTDKDKELVGILLTALERISSRTYAAAFDDGNGHTDASTAIDDIRDIVSPLLEGADFEDYMKDALHEVKFILMEDDSPEKKLDSIKYIVEEALK